MPGTWQAEVPGSQEPVSILLVAFPADGMLGRAPTQEIANLLLRTANMGQHLPHFQTTCACLYRWHSVTSPSTKGVCFYASLVRKECADVTQAKLG